MPRLIEGLNYKKMQGEVKWSGMLRLHMLDEDDESLLCDQEWPKKSGKIYFACASTGLLFEKQSGRCLQSSLVTLKIETVKPLDAARGGYKRWLKEKMEREEWGGMKRLRVGDGGDE